MLRLKKTSLLACVAFFAPTPCAWAQEASHLSQLANEAQWKKILYYAPTWFNGTRSLIDDARFFLSKKGKIDAELELKATVQAFTEGTPAKRQQALCKYPARRKWLEERLKKKFADPAPEDSSEICKRLATFTTNVHSDKVSLIFSSYFPGNPASLFGHTLLKFKKNSEEGQPPNELLDFGLNHSAHTGNTNPLLFPFLGLTGRFPGYVSFMPYYVKVQEYNNSESRDLWEYELSLTADEVQMILLSVFELSTHKIDYYYFDDNCSLMMLAVLDVARPNLRLVEKFDAWVIPGDTIRIVAMQPNLLGAVKFRASNVKRYLAHEKMLTAVERTAFNALLEKKQAPKEKEFPLEALNRLSNVQKMHVLDTALEYFDADEKLAANETPRKWNRERNLLLKARAELGIVSPPLVVETPQNEAPGTAYPSARLSFGIVHAVGGNSTNQTGALLGWRPALQTLDSPAAGMSSDLGISFLNLEGLLQEQGVVLREFTLLSIEAIPLKRPNLSSLSWQFEAGYKQRCFANCQQTFINYEAGRAWTFTGNEGRIALRGGLRVGDDSRAAFFAEPGVVAVLNLPMSEAARWSTRVSLSRQTSLWEGSQWVFEGMSRYTFRPISPWESSISIGVHNSEAQFVARGLYYF